MNAGVTDGGKISAVLYRFADVAATAGLYCTAGICL